METVKSVLQDVLESTPNMHAAPIADLINSYYEPQVLDLNWETGPDNLNQLEDAIYEALCIWVCQVHEEMNYMISKKQYNFLLRKDNDTDDYCLYLRKQVDPSQVADIIIDFKYGDHHRSLYHYYKLEENSKEILEVIASRIFQVESYIFSVDTHDEISDCWNTIFCRDIQKQYGDYEYETRLRRQFNL